MIDEVWKPVADYEGLYDISNYGRIRSLPHHTPSRFGMKLSPGRLLKPDKSRNQYLRIQLSKNGIIQRFLVHRLVAISFLPKVNGKGCVNHIDGTRTNNHISNLEWCTYRENTQHAMKMGTIKQQPYCKKGLHMLTEENAGQTKNGRYCRPCRNNRLRDEYQRLRLFFNQSNVNEKPDTVDVRGGDGNKIEASGKDGGK